MNWNFFLELPGKNPYRMFYFWTIVLQYDKKNIVCTIKKKFWKICMNLKFIQMRENCEKLQIFTVDFSRSIKVEFPRKTWPSLDGLSIRILSRLLTERTYAAGPATPIFRRILTLRKRFHELNALGVCRLHFDVCKQ